MTHLHARKTNRQPSCQCTKNHGGSYVGQREIALKACLALLSSIARNARWKNCRLVWGQRPQFLTAQCWFMQLNSWCWLQAASIQSTCQPQKENTRATHQRVFPCQTTHQFIRVASKAFDSAFSCDSDTCHGQTHQSERARLWNIRDAGNPGCRHASLVTTVDFQG